MYPTEYTDQSSSEAFDSFIFSNALETNLNLARYILCYYVKCLIVITQYNNKYHWKMHLMILWFYVNVKYAFRKLSKRPSICTGCHAPCCRILQWGMWSTPLRPVNTIMNNRWCKQLTACETIRWLWQRTLRLLVFYLRTLRLIWDASISRHALRTQITSHGKSPVCIEMRARTCYKKRIISPFDVVNFAEAKIQSTRNVRWRT